MSPIIHRNVFSYPPHARSVPSSSIRVGDLILFGKNQRVPADLVLLRNPDSSGTCFIRTGQLDGETGWKVRAAVPTCQKLYSNRDLLGLDAEIHGMNPIASVFLPDIEFPPPQPSFQHRTEKYIREFHPVPAIRAREKSPPIKVFVLSLGRSPSIRSPPSQPTAFQWSLYQLWGH